MARRPTTYWIFFALAGLLTTLTVYWAFFMAPHERVMGLVQKIFYFHVPCAMAMQGLFITCGGASLWYLMWGSEKADRLAVATAEVGVLMAAFVLITGPLWARKAWGYYWQWEPRLTLTMVVCFLFAAYIALRNFGGDDPLTKRISAGLAISGAPAIYLVRVAVEKWGGTHPQVVYKGGLENMDMRIAFALGVFGFATFAVVLAWERYKLQTLKSDVDELTMMMMERDLLEEDEF